MSAHIRYTSHQDGQRRPYSAAAVHHGLAFPCGQVPVDDDGSIPPGITAQAVAVIKNHERVLLAGSSSLDHLRQVTVILADLKRVRRLHYRLRGSAGRPDAATADVRSSGRLSRCSATEITAIAAIKESTENNTEERS